MKSNLKMDEEGLKSYKEKIEKLEKELSDLRFYKGTDAINQGDTWHDNPTLYQTEQEERSLINQIEQMKSKIPEIQMVENFNNEELVDIGDTVIIDMIFSPDDIEEQTFKLIGGDTYFDTNTQQVSINSPLGNAIYHKKVGDFGEYKVDLNTIKFLIKQNKKK